MQYCHHFLLCILYFFSNIFSWSPFLLNPTSLSFSQAVYAATIFMSVCVCIIISYLFACLLFLVINWTFWIIHCSNSGYLFPFTLGLVIIVNICCFICSETHCILLVKFYFSSIVLNLWCWFPGRHSFGYAQIYSGMTVVLARILPLFPWPLLATKLRWLQADCFIVSTVPYGIDYSTNSAD